MYLILLQRDGAQASMCGGTHGDPPHTQADLGVGGRVRERELCPRDHMTCYVIVRPCHVTIPGQREGGDPQRHRSRDTSFIGEELSVLGLEGPMPQLNRKYTRNTHLFSVHTRQAHIRPRRSFFAYSALNINF